MQPEGALLFLFTLTDEFPPLDVWLWATGESGASGEIKTDHTSAGVCFHRMNDRPTPWRLQGWLLNQGLVQSVLEKAEETSGAASKQETPLWEPSCLPSASLFIQEKWEEPWQAAGNKEVSTSSSVLRSRFYMRLKSSKGWNWSWRVN